YEHPRLLPLVRPLRRPRPTLAHHSGPFGPPTRTALQRLDPPLASGPAGGRRPFPQPAVESAPGLLVFSLANLPGGGSLPRGHSPGQGPLSGRRRNVDAVFRAKGSVRSDF